MLEVSRRVVYLCSLPLQRMALYLKVGPAHSGVITSLLSCNDVQIEHVHKHGYFPELFLLSSNET